MSGTVVAVTGATSFLGRNLVALLEEDERVQRTIAIDVKAPTRVGAKTRPYDVDLTEPLAEVRMGEIFGREEVDTVVHLAFLSSPTNATAWAHELESVGTMHVLNAARDANVTKIVMRSHTLLYGAYPNNPNYLTEDHPLRARRSEPFLADKIRAERDVLAYGAEGKDRTVTILRMAPLVGPSVRGYVGRYLSHRVVPTILGFDPLWQLLHETDAVAALKLSVDRDAPGVFNVVGDGVLPLSTVVKLASRVGVPMPRFAAKAMLSALWIVQVGDAPPTLLDYLQYLCVADGERARRHLGFAPAYTTREALLDFAGAQHMRDARLLTEATS
ncbi:MAG TPA: NAD-dependent epimerase/dehydratase family protein [Polyangiaceae bacterium]|jgi:UDP-glucose 4-epimerase|nr:NAD-dependent epimerase/dehydratase family protein [Polyangiaceae bacterium]